MREILFRGKDERTKEWRIGSLLDFDRDSGYLYIVEPYFGASSLPVFALVQDQAHFVISETVGQDTGLRDRNGVRIFEGDVVEFDKGQFVVEYFESRMGFGFSGLKGRGVVCGFTMTDWEHLEVIGNIHDDPALLEV